MRWIKHGIHTFYSRDEKKKWNLRLWACVDEDGHTMYQVYRKLNDPVNGRSPSLQN